MIILGSASPRRKELFEWLGVSFKVVVADIDESIEPNSIPSEAACAIAEKKMEALRAIYAVNDSLCVTADTIVVDGNSILGKPKNRQDAYTMLVSLSGKKHSVITAVCIDYFERRHTFFENTEVWFSDLSDDDIHEYLNADDFSDKAGAYGIQGAARFLIEKIKGDYYNVVGFPMNRFLREVRTIFGKDIREL